MKDTLLSLIHTDCPFRGSLHWYDTIDSTNTRAKQLAREGAPHGTVIIAGSQSAGRGRLGRSFSSPPGSGAYLSVILRPQCQATQLMHLTCAAAVAACDALEKLSGQRPGIKWINDLILESKKLGGILTELSIDPKTAQVQYAVVGIGINCCQRPSDFPEEIQGMAGSLSMISEKQIDRSRVAAAMIDALHRMDSGLLTDKKATMDRYRADCITLGKDISLVKADGSVRHGHAMDIDDEGALIVQFADGTLETVNSGEVSVRGMYGYA